MPMSRSDRRAALADARIHLSRAIASLPEGDRDIRHWPALLAVMVHSINDEIGTEAADEPAAGLTGPCLGLHAGDCRCGEDAVPDDAEMPFAHPKAAGELTERELAHNFELPRHDPREC